MLSYTTSPAYHEIVEKTERYKALVFPEGNYMQIEVAGRIEDFEACRSGEILPAIPDFNGSAEGAIRN